jgi:hypothetical protein
LVRALTRSVPALATRVLGARHEPAVREERAHVPEARDAVDLEVERERGDLPDAGNPEEPLHVRVRDQCRQELPFEPLDLRREQDALLGVELTLEARERRQLGRRRDVVLGEQARDSVLAAGALGHEDQPLAEQVAGLAHLGADHVGRRDQVRAQQLREGGRVHGVGLHLGVADRLDVLAVPKREAHALAPQVVGEPVPGRCRLDNGALRLGPERGEVPRDRRARRPQARGLDGLAGRVHGGHDEVALVQVDPRVQHELSEGKGCRMMRRPGLLGNIMALQTTPYAGRGQRGPEVRRTPAPSRTHNGAPELGR